MIERAQERYPRSRARMTGVVYLLYFLTAIVAQLLVSRALVIYGNAANLIADGFYIALTLLFYVMFRPVNRIVSLIAAVLSMTGCAVMIVGLIPRVTISMSPLWFFGPYCLLIGYLVFRSTFLPRILGVLMALAGVGWLAFLVPAVARNLTLYVEILGVVAEASLMLWLIVMGVNVKQWNAQTETAKGHL